MWYIWFNAEFVFRPNSVVLTSGHKTKNTSPSCALLPFGSRALLSRLQEEGVRLALLLPSVFSAATVIDTTPSTSYSHSVLDSQPHMTLTLRRPSMNPVAPSPIDNMEDLKRIKVAQLPIKDSFRTLAESTMLSDISSTVSLEDDELQDVVEDEEEEEYVKPRYQPLASTSRQSRKTSILKPIDHEIPIKAKAFKTLPAPDMSRVKSVTNTTEKTRSTLKRNHCVGFATITIREYEQTIGDNPSVSYGPPISLDWEYQQLEPVTLEHYEAHRAPRRTLRQMCMNYYTRRNVLTYKFGYSEEEVKQAAKQADKVKRGRAVTKYFLPYAKVEDLVTSAGRKAKRVVVKKKSEAD